MVAASKLVLGTEIMMDKTAGNAGALGDLRHGDVE
jgi:hypothetical protein